MSNKGDKFVKVNGRFNHNKTVIYLSNNSLLSTNIGNATSDQDKSNMILINLEKKLKNIFDNE